MSSVQIFGIRHHGPGSARSLRDALVALEPDCVLVEGPPEGDKLLPLVNHPEMAPPVALLVYCPEQFGSAVYYPFALFSPEWQAIKYGLQHGITVRFIDLPQSNWLALKPKVQKSGNGDSKEMQSPRVVRSRISLKEDPLNWLARAAGYSDGERWWEHLVEERRNSAELFQAINEAMASLRQSMPIGQSDDTDEIYEDDDALEHQDEQVPERDDDNDDEIENLREAHMRQMIRTAQKEGFARIAVVCGAWHAPALESSTSSSKADAALLKGLPKRKVEVTWIPWTHGRLSYSSGYGAGINSPGWYHHLWSCNDFVAERWVSHVAHLLRSEDLDASPASVIEAVRLSEALAALRERPLPGLEELNDSVKAVLCFGQDTPMRLIYDKLIVGEQLGTVPDVTPSVPLRQDLQAEQKRLRMPVDASEKIYDLDLRKETDLNRSRLLHRLELLGIPWGAYEHASGKSGTFHEIWRVKWQPEFSLRLIERSVWGRTIYEAATGFASDLARKATKLSALTSMLEKALHAELPAAIDCLMTTLETQAALASDVKHLMAALPPLAQIARYGDVRNTDLSAVTHIIDGIFERICIGLPASCSSLDNDAAGEMYEQIQNVNSAVGLLQNEQHFSDWTEALRKLADTPSIHGLVGGRASRTLLDTRQFDADEAANRFSFALSRASDPDQAAQWAEGFLKGSGLLLLHNDVLWDVIDIWLSSLPDDYFMQALPLMRRTFSTFTRPERRQIGERAAKQRLARKSHESSDLVSCSDSRGSLVLDTVAAILGVPGEFESEFGSAAMTPHAKNSDGDAQETP